MSNEPVEHIELNILNYNEDQVSQLNEWAIWAYEEIELLKEELRRETIRLKNERFLSESLEEEISDLQNEREETGI